MIVLVITFLTVSLVTSEAQSVNNVTTNLEVPRKVVDTLNKQGALQNQSNKPVDNSGASYSRIESKNENIDLNLYKQQGIISQSIRTDNDYEGVEQVTSLQPTISKGIPVKTTMTLEVTEGYDDYNVSQEVEAPVENMSWTAGLHPHHSKWQEFGPFFTFTMFIVITGLTKIGFHHAGFLISRLPESCLLIVSGAMVGAVMHAMGADASSQRVLHSDSHPALQWPLLPEFTPTLFFAVLLPPIILESAYTLYDRQFANNLLTVLLYAVAGTIFNAFAIGSLLYLAVISGAVGSLEGSLNGNTYFTLSLSDCFLFGSVASAVDPVAVLAIFQEVGVNKDLYFLLFGESLLNDAVTVALYSTMVTFTQLEKIGGGEYGASVAFLLAAGIGGALIGVLGGCLTAIVTRATRKCRVVEPLAVLGLAYLTYLTAELFHLSGIVSIITCGLTQSHYALKNISHKSFTTVKYFTKMISCVSDSAVFLFLGAALVGELYAWHTSFIIWAIILCLACRFTGVFTLTAVNNAVSKRYVGWKYQLVLGYGGLRGATCYALACMLDEAYPPARLFSTAALAIVLFTVFLQGGTIKFLVRGLQIEKLSTTKKTLNEEINEHVTTMLLAGIEEIASARGDYYIQRKLELFDDRYLKKIFLNSDAESDLQHLFEKISLMEHYDHLYRRKSTFSQEGSRTPVRHHDTLFLRTFGIPFAVPRPLQPPQPRQRLRLTVLRNSIWRRNRPRSTAPEILHDAIREGPFQQQQYPHNLMVVADRPREMQEELENRRASVVLRRASSATSISGPQGA